MSSDDSGELPVLSGSDVELPSDVDSDDEEPSRKVRRRKSKGNRTVIFKKRKNTSATGSGRGERKINEKKDNILDEDLDMPSMEEESDDPSDDETTLAEALSFLRTADLTSERDVKVAIKKRSRYQETLEKGDKYFEANKSFIKDSYLEAMYVRERRCCVFCEEEGVIFCKSCGDVCILCDIKKHCLAPLHSRSYGGKDLPPGVTVSLSDQGFFKFDTLTPISESLRKICDQCLKPMKIAAKSELHTIVHLTNSCVSKQPTFKCEDCNLVKSPTLSDYIKSGLFPLNGDTTSTTVATLTVLQFWRNLKNLALRCGLGSFIATLTKNGWATLNQQTFDKLYTQYNNILYTIETETLCEKPFQCPVIKSQKHRPHIDGDSKLSNFLATYWTKSKGSQFYGDDFIGDDEELLRLIDMFKRFNFVSKSDAHCGVSSWKAGVNTDSGSPVFEAKGIQVAGCEHYFYLYAYNQPCGELFCLDALLIKKLEELGYNFSQIELDISCLFCKWYARLKKCTLLLEEIGFEWKDILALIGDFHSQGHSLFCRIMFGCLWSGEGRPSGGEMMEVLNAPLSRLRDRTRFMKLHRRNDEISEKVAYDNQNRSEVIVEVLVNKRERLKSEFKTLGDELLVSEGRIKKEITVSDINDVKVAARTILDKKFSALEDRIEFLVLSLMHKKRQLKICSENSVISKLRENLKSVKNNLTKAVADYNDGSEEKIVIADLLSGIFPWQTKLFKETSRIDNPNEFLKACELFLKRQNTLVEIEIMQNDIACVIQSRREHIELLLNKAESESKLNKVAIKNKVASLIQRMLRDKRCVSSIPDLSQLADSITFDTRLFPCEIPKVNEAELLIESTYMPLNDSD